MSKSKKSHASLRKKQARRRRRIAEEICASKHQYATSRLANIEADKITRRSGAKMRAYLCSICGKYHLTSH